MKIDNFFQFKPKSASEYGKKIITYIAIFLIISLIFYTIYIFEKYFIYNPTHFIVYLIMKILFIYSPKLNSFLTFISIIFTILFHIKLFQIVVLSIVFISGGIFSRFAFYRDLTAFLDKQIEYSRKAIFCLSGESIKEKDENIIEYFMNKIILFQKVYNTEKMRSNTFELNEFPFGNHLNEAIYQYNNLKDQNYKSESLKKSIINYLKLYQNDLKSYFNFSKLDILLKLKYYNTLYLFDSILLKSFEDRSCSNINISSNFDIYIISPKFQEIKYKTLVIFCNQNAISVERYTFSQENIKFYLEIPEITIILWNYQGFGSRCGFPSFSSMDKDVEELYEYIQKNYSDYKIIIHGISIGGYPAIKLANYFDEKNKNICLIADRTFSDIDLIVETFFKHGNIFKKIYNFLFPKFIYHSENLDNYIDVKINNKFIFFDEKDVIIHDNPSSLIYNITKKYFNDIILPKIKYYSEFHFLIDEKSKEFDSLKLELKNMNFSCHEKFDQDTKIFIKELYENLKNFKDFVMFFTVFGFPHNLFKEINFKQDFTNCLIKIPEIMKIIGTSYKNKLSLNLIDYIAKINFLFIKSNLNTVVSDDNLLKFDYENNDFDIQERVREKIHKYFGYVHRIFCGHNGSYDEKDNKYLIEFLILNGFIGEENRTNKKNKNDLPSFLV